MDLGLKGKVAVVTGGSEGLGAAICRRLDAEGCRLAIISRSVDKLQNLKATLTGEYSSEALILQCDVTKVDDVDHAVRSVLERWPLVNILVNNAGGPATGALSPFQDLSDRDFLASFEFNVLSAVRFIRALLPALIESGAGRVISISSESAVQPDAVGADYNLAKAGLNTLSKTLSKAYGKAGVLFNTVSPAFTMTPLLESGVKRLAKAGGMSLEEATSNMLENFRPNIVVARPGHPDEVAAAVAYLASVHAGFTTGTNVRIDGGSVASVAG